MIELGFAINTSVSTVPSVSVYLDNRPLITNHMLVGAGKVGDPEAKLHWLDIDSEIPKGHHILEIRAANIDDRFKKNGDFGFQVGSVILNKFNLAWFDIPFKSVNPVTIDYIDAYIKPNNLEHEIVATNHVRHGPAANYVNFADGYVSLEFVCPLYDWLLSKNFDKLSRILLRNQ